MAVFRLPARPLMRPLLLGSTCFFLAACDQPLDFDLRDLGGGFDTTDAAQNATAARPPSDNRGVISYPNYQVALARRGDTVADVARRIGLSPDELARHNGLTTGDVLREGELISLPRRVTEPSPATGSATTGPLTPSQVDVTELAGSAIANAEASQPRVIPNAPTGVEPIRHRVERGETAFSIARLYNVSPRSLAEWNGLDSAMSVREGQFLLIPVVVPGGSPTPAAVNDPGTGSPTPTPPSAVQPLPEDNPNIAAAAPRPESPDLGAQQTQPSNSDARMQMPADGPIIRAFRKGTNDGIDIGAAAGAPVRAADGGEVAAITADTDQVPILVLRHSDGLLTVYANIDDIAVAEGAQVRKGQKIAEVRGSDAPFLHFEVRKGFDAVDPMPYLN
ncbi:LysM peptidoglycan-binding domain-containing M23 family metallopeptidase [Cognatishimia sp. MH4019]|uniref:LysM peptidoglycan-binding domain-containing M23 family metallopeptidase n=1 Tax=Cognatishimia sp. MH4019 TaxID=2854030 RepID=UPI001CD2E850|nr:LysM peptidoglycan-binding domain-containing M23 family metallopeptidase [Cognatishimia sp. MH4019]